MSRSRVGWRSRSSRIVGGGGGSGGGIEYDLIGEDSFTDTNGVNLDVHTAELGSWVGSTLEVQSNRMASTAASGSALMEGEENGQVEVTLAVAPGVFDSGPAIVVHFIDTNNFISFGGFFGAWLLGETTGGVIAQSVAGPAIAAGQTAKVRFQGNTVTAYVNGNLVATLTGIAAGKLTETSHGFYNPGVATTARFDDWRLYAPVPLV